MSKRNIDRNRRLATVVTDANTAHSAAIGVLALLYGIGGAALLTATRIVMHDGSDLRVPLLVGATETAIGVLLALARHRLHPRVVPLGIGLRVLTTSLLSACCPAAAGIALVGMRCLALVMFAAWFLPRRFARLTSGALLTGYSAGAAVAHVDGSLVPWLVITLAVIASGETFGYLIDQLRQQADVDPLTGLANRASFRRAATREIALAQRGRAPLSLALLDLDDFKTVNDSLGHLAGDALLGELAHAWQTQLRRGDLLARVGGDEFALLLPATTLQEGRQLLGRLHSAHHAPWSAGISTWTTGTGLDDMLHTADKELYETKAARRRRDLHAARRRRHRGPQT